MILSRNDVPVVVVNCKLGGLAIMRSLGRLGVVLHGVDSGSSAPAFASRYCRSRRIQSLEAASGAGLLRTLEEMSDRLAAKAILIPTSDDTALFVAENRERLAGRYVFQDNDAQLVAQLISKEGMYGLARQHGVPVPHTVFPKSVADVEAYIDGRGQLPVMLKAIDGTRLFRRTGKKMVLVTTAAELRQRYRALDEPGFPNLMLQEYIPGGDDQIYIFNGYFDRASQCLAGYTGHKIRQFPIHVGCASLGIQEWNPKVADITTDFMRAIGYRGVLDIGYRLDPRDGLYKVLDINPRVGQAFRLFLSENGLDVVRALYLDFAGQDVPRSKPCEGRRWMIEDLDLISSLHYRQEGSLRFWPWLRSYWGVQEGMWFSWRDPKPFLIMAGGLLRRMFGWSGKRVAGWFGRYDKAPSA
jgi:predicted ATP-grasp superfamily ATP-dependent carboligase